MIRIKLKLFNALSDKEKITLWIQLRKLLLKEGASELGITVGTLWNYRTEKHKIPSVIIQIITLDLIERGILLPDEDS